MVEIKGRYSLAQIETKDFKLLERKMKLKSDGHYTDEDIFRAGIESLEKTTTTKEK